MGAGVSAGRTVATAGGTIGSDSDALFRDDDLAAMYDPDNGRPSLPPSLMAGMMLLQFYDDVADGDDVMTSPAVTARLEAYLDMFKARSGSTDHQYRARAGLKHVA